MAELADLRALSEWFARQPLSETRTLSIETLLRRLGAVAVPLLGREVRRPDVARRDAARDALALLAATGARARVLAELRAIIAADPARLCDEAKVCALGLLAELGAPGTPELTSVARFRDPLAMQRRSALALAAQLDSAADIASAVDFMVRQLPDEDILQILELVADAVPPAASRLAGELVARLDISSELRACVTDLAPTTPTIPTNTLAPRARSACATVLVDASERAVVVATRKVPGQRRWRRWAVLISAGGTIDDCLHEDTTVDRDGASLITELCRDGYRVVSHELEHARAVLATAARLTGPDLPSPYYLGRDLLDLGANHLAGRTARAHHDRIAGTLGRASELLADGDPARARAVLARDRPHLPDLDPTNPDRAALEAACLVAEGKLADAIEPLRRAVAGEPAWPLHHWNLGVVLYRLGDASGAHQALQRFVTTSAVPSALVGDAEQSERVACAERVLAELERIARLAGSPLAHAPQRAGSRARRALGDWCQTPVT